MKLKPRTLSVNNVVSLTMELQEGDDLLEVIDETVDHFRQVLVQNGYYTTGPMMFRGLPHVREFTIMASVGNRVNLVGDRGTGFGFSEHVEVETDFFYRHWDVAEPVPYEEIVQAVSAAGSRVVNIDHVVLDFYGETVLDLYVEAVKR